MKLIFAVLHVSRTMGLTRCYKTEVFFTLIHITGHSSDAGGVRDRESSPAKDRRSTTMPRH